MPFQALLALHSSAGSPSLRQASRATLQEVSISGTTLQLMLNPSHGDFLAHGASLRALELLQWRAVDIDDGKVVEALHVLLDRLQPMLTPGSDRSVAVSFALTCPLRRLPSHILCPGKGVLHQSLGTPVESNPPL